MSEVLHGWWSPRSESTDQGCLVLWAEDADVPAVRRPRTARRARLPDHPFAVGAERLQQRLGVLASRATLGAAELILPGFTHTPLPSPQALDLGAPGTLAEGQTPRGDVRWLVPTVALGPADALILLSELPGHPCVAGAELSGLANLAAFAADLARRGRVLPVALREDDRHGHARWLPVVTGPDADWLRSAVGALPASYPAGLDGDPVPSVAAALDALTDAFVRLRLGDAPRRTAVGLAGWRAALRGDDARFSATAEQLTGIVAGIDRWQRDALGDGAVRACFRLVEPADDDETSVLRRPDAPQRSGWESEHWRVDIGLQMADEPSHFIEASRVWAGDTLPASLTRHGRPTEMLLAELGRAVRLYPRLAEALAGPRPAELLLEVDDAQDFLAEAAPLLLGAGFGVLLPGWWASSKARLGARLRAGTPAQPGRVEGTPVFGQEHLVDFDWQISVGDHTLSDAEVDRLIEANRPLVRMRGEWLQVDPDRLRAAQDFLRRRQNGSMTVGQVLQVIGADDGPGGLPVTGVDAEGWLASLLEPGSERRLAAVPVPAGFEGALRPYQQRGLAWLSFLDDAGLGGLLADDMGLGKTVQLLALFARDLGVGPPTLLVCPMSLVGNWEREAARFVPEMRVHVHHGAARLAGDAFEEAAAQADLVVTTYALLARDAALLRSVTWRRVVLDEAQAVKNAATRASVAARTLGSPHRIAVTGTPVENRLADLWALMEFANPGLLGDPTGFKRRFALPIERVGDTGAADRLKRLTGPFVLRRVKTDTSIIDDLPPKLEMEVACSLTAEQAALYQGVVDEMLARVDDSSGIERRGLVLAAMTKLKQVCNHPAQLLHDGSRVPGRSGKLARLEEVIEEVLASGERVLLFTQFASFGEMLRTHLSARFGREVAFLHGGVPKKQRDALVERFQGDSGPPIFVLSLKAGGTGLNLTAANHVIHVDRWWNPAVEDQATDRAFRIGQSRTVQVRTFVCAGTLEERIAAMIRDKRALASSVMESGEAWLTELSTEQLRELVSLDRAVVE